MVSAARPRADRGSEEGVPMEYKTISAVRTSTSPRHVRGAAGAPEGDRPQVLPDGVWRRCLDLVPRCLATPDLDQRPGRQEVRGLPQADQLRQHAPGSFLPRPRIEDMDLDGIDADILFPASCAGWVPSVRTCACSAPRCTTTGWPVLQLRPSAPDRAGRGRARRSRGGGRRDAPGAYAGLRSRTSIKARTASASTTPTPSRSGRRRADMPINLHIGTSPLGGLHAAPELAKLPGSQERLDRHRHDRRRHRGDDLSGLFDRILLKVVAEAASAGFRTSSSEWRASTTGTATTCIHHCRSGRRSTSTVTSGDVSGGPSGRGVAAHDRHQQPDVQQIPAHGHDLAALAGSDRGAFRQHFGGRRYKIVAGNAVTLYAQLRRPDSL